MNFSFAHIVSIVTGGLAAVAALNPALVAAVYPPAVPYAAAAIAGAGALLNLIHAAAPKAPSVTTVAKMLPYLFVGVLFAALSLPGCASVSSFFSSPTGSATIVAAVDVAVATAEQKGVSAVDINRIAKLALAADSGASGTLSAVSSLVNTQVAKLNLPAADLAAAEVLEIALSSAVSAKLQGNAALATAQADVAQILRAVIAASGG